MQKILALIAMLFWALTSQVAMASEYDELVIFRKQYVDFVARTSEDLVQITRGIDESSRILRDSKMEATEVEAVVKMTADVWRLRMLVELAQDVLLASVVEAGIAIDTGGRSVIYADSINRFPAPILDLTTRISIAFSAIENEVMSSAWKNMKPHVADLAEAFKDWPGPHLKQQMQQGQPGNGDLPDDVVKLAVQVDETVNASLEYNGSVMRIADQVAASNMSYSLALRQYARNIEALAAGAIDTLMLVTASQRLEITKAKAVVTKDDREIVDHYLGWRLKHFHDVLSLSEKQCGMLVDDHQRDCARILKAYKYFGQKFEKYLVGDSAKE